MDNIKRDIEAAYGSLVRPDWSFVAKRLNDGAYDELVKDLAELASVLETTDQNDDCSRCLFIEDVLQALTLRLSLVGKYACAHDGNGGFFTKFDFRNNPLGKKLFPLLEAGEIEFLDAEVLRRKIKFGGGINALYQVLFSSDELIS